VKYNACPSGDHVAQSSGSASAMVIQALSGTGVGPSSGAMAMRARVGAIRTVKLSQRPSGEKRP